MRDGFVIEEDYWLLLQEDNGCADYRRNRLQHVQSSACIRPGAALPRYLRVGFPLQRVLRTRERTEQERTFQRAVQVTEIDLIYMVYLLLSVTDQ